MSIPTKTFVVLVLAALAVPAPAIAFHEDDIPVIFSTGGSGSGSYGVKFDHAGGDFAIDLYGVGPQSAQSVSVAAFLFDANKNLQFGFAFTGHSSPDRLILSPAGADGDIENIPAWLDITVHTWDSTTDAACTFACVGMSGEAAPAGTYYYLLWVSGVSANSFEVRANGGSVVANAGDAWSIGDAEITSGAVNVQAQQTPAAGATVGAKVMQDASASIEVSDSLWGFFGASDFKLACQFTVGACVWRSQVTYTCYDLGASCDTTSVSYSGPSGSGSGQSLYLFSGGAPGAYTFSVDKLDAYGPNVYDPTTGSWLSLGEDYTYLTAADNELP